MEKLLQKLEGFERELAGGRITPEIIYFKARNLVEETVRKMKRVELNEDDGLYAHWIDGRVILSLDNELTSLDELSTGLIIEVLHILVEKVRTEVELKNFRFNDTGLKMFRLKYSEEIELKVFAHDINEAMALLEEGYFFTE